MDTTYIIHENDDKTITIYSDKKQAFYKLNYLASLIYRNIELGDKELIEHIEKEFEITEVNIKEIFNFRDELNDFILQL